MSSHAIRSNAGARLAEALCESSVDPTVRIATVRLDLDHRASIALYSLLCADERARAARFRFEKDRRRFIIARGTLRRILGRELGLKPHAVTLEYGSHGKPQLGGGLAGSPLRFNLSHSADLAVIATVRGREIGVDVEAVQRIVDAHAVARQFFSARENREYSRLSAAQKSSGFFNCWTRKEALVKAWGEGLSHPLDTFDVTLAPGDPARLLRMDEQSGAECGWHLESFVPATGYVAAVAVSGAQGGVRIDIPEQIALPRPAAAARLADRPRAEPVGAWAW